MRNLRALLITTGLGLALASSIVLASGTSSQLVGANKCGECHKSAYDAWKKSPHSNAYNALPDQNKADPRCTHCHGVIGHENTGVQCESCHGAGKYYAKRHVMKDEKLARIVGLVDVSKEDCQRCHTETTPSIRPFVWRRSWSLISHGQEPEEVSAGQK